MSELSNILVKLAVEVLSLCKEHNIPCILSDDTAHTIIDNSYDLTSLSSIQLLIHTDDFDKLFDILSTTSIPHRGIESMKNNDLYPTFSMYYADTKTIAYLSDSNYIYQCVGIHILPLRKNPGKFRKNFFNHLESWNLGIGQTLYPKLLSVYSTKNAKNVYLRCNGKKCIDFSTAELTDINTISTSSYTFPVSSLNESRENLSCRLSCILEFQQASQFHPASLIHTNNNQSKQIWCQLPKVLLKMGKRYLKEKFYPVTQDWRKLQCVNERNTQKVYYEAKLPLIRELVKNQDTARLKKELLPYHKAICHHYDSCKLTIKFDQEIFDLYLQLYLNTADDAYRKAIIRHIPKVWR